MMPNTMLLDSLRPVRNDRASRELRAYARQEWNADVAWFRSLLPRMTLGSRIRRWVLLRRPSAAVRTAAPEPQSAPAAGAPPVPPAVVQDCPHPSVEEIGSAGYAEFLRCSLCGHVLVVEGGRQWSIEPGPPAAVEGLPGR